jgi:phosphoglycerate dehydrogenase-like enzyme
LGRLPFAGKRLMAAERKPVILIADPEPRALPMIFEPEVMTQLGDLGEVVVHAEGQRLPRSELDEALGKASIVIGQIDLPAERLERMPKLRAIFNVEGNLLPNIDYGRCFERGVHVLNTSPVYATSVAETALGMAIDLARGITHAHEAFRTGTEKWGLTSNNGCFLLTGANVGIIGLGDLGSALRRMLTPFRCPVRVYDPWLPARRIREQDCEPSGLDKLLETSRIVFVFASSTNENQGFLGAREFALMPQGSILLLMSRAGVADFGALEASVRSGRIRAGIDVFPVEPLPKDSSLRSLDGVILSGHRSGGMPESFLEIGRLILSDAELVLRGLPPQVCKRAERETAARMRSRPVAAS